MYIERKWLVISNASLTFNSPKSAKMCRTLFLEKLKGLILFCDRVPDLFAAKQRKDSKDRYCSIRRHYQRPRLLARSGGNRLRCACLEQFSHHLKLLWIQEQPRS